MDEITMADPWHGGRMKYYWRVSTRLPERKGQRCNVLIRGKMNSCLVEFEDGYRVVTSRNYIRKAVDTEGKLS